MQTTGGHPLHESQLSGQGQREWSCRRTWLSLKRSWRRLVPKWRVSNRCSKGTASNLRLWRSSFKAQHTVAKHHCLNEYMLRAGVRIPNPSSILCESSPRFSSRERGGLYLKRHLFGNSPFIIVMAPKFGSVLSFIYKSKRSPSVLHPYPNPAAFIVYLLPRLSFLS
ncbi:hypothetical protein ACLOJK_037146 [Asimina triloba]